MCIRDRARLAAALREGKAAAADPGSGPHEQDGNEAHVPGCLLYTSDAADERSSVDLGGRRIIKKKKKSRTGDQSHEKRNPDSS